MFGELWPPLVTLWGEHSILEPLKREHVPGLAAVVKDGALWELWVTSVASPEDMAVDVERRLELREQVLSLRFSASP